MRCCQVNDPALIEHTLIHDHPHLRKPWDLRQMRVALGNGLLTSEGDFWRKQRGLLQPAFRTQNLRSYADVMVRHASERVSTWEDDERIDLFDEMLEITLRVVAECLFGLDILEHSATVKHATTTFMDRFEAMLRAPLPVPLTVPTPANRRMARSLRALDDVVYTCIEQRKSHPGDGDDLLTQLVAVRDEDDRALSTKQLRDEMVTLLLAGFETTAVALTFSLWLVATHPETEQMLVTELDEVLEDTLPDGRDQVELRYTHQVVQEAMRLYPPAWGIAREARTDLHVGDYPVPRGTQLFFTQWVTHRDPRFWEDPERFDPDRFEDGAGANRPKYAYYPFGGGLRTCIGKHFARLETAMVLATVMQSVHLEMDDPEAPDLQPAVSLRPRSPIRPTVRFR